MPEQNESAASAALEDTTAAAEAADDKLINSVHADVLASHPPHDGVTEAELQALREKALSDAELEDELVNGSSDGVGENISQSQQRLFVSLGDIVYFGDGSNEVWPAIVTHVYGENIPPNVDLQVLKRKHICDAENVAHDQLAGPHALNGWVFKA